MYLQEGGKRDPCDQKERKRSICDSLPEVIFAMEEGSQTLIQDSERGLESDKPGFALWLYCPLCDTDTFLSLVSSSTKCKH